MKLGELLRSKKLVSAVVVLTMLAGFIVYDGSIGAAHAHSTFFRKDKIESNYYNVDHEVSILSQNLRAPQDKDGKDNSITKRTPRIMNMLDKYNTDIRCFQECTYEWKARLDIQMSAMEYKTEFLFNNKGLCNPIYVKNSKFKVLDGGSMVLTPDSTDTYNESRVASWLKVADKTTGKTLVIMNAHLATESTRQITSCTKMMEKVQTLDADGYIICGDFNFDMNSNPGAYAIMKGDTGKDMAIAAGQEGVQKYTGGTFHDFGRKSKPKRIDFFFGSGNLQSKLYSLIKDSYDGGYLSDHYGILTYIDIN